MLSSKNLFDDLSIASYTLTLMVYLESDHVLKPRIMGITKITNFRISLSNAVPRTISVCKSIVQRVGSTWCNEEACLGNNRLLVQFLVAQMRNQTQIGRASCRERV